ncbi:MAG: hypothetical protein WKF30_03775 [Pyrinomonadaceae bacterium]
MRFRPLLSLLVVFTFVCSSMHSSSADFSVALESDPETLDPLRGTDAASERAADV